jgi:hypothetical protein
VGEVINKDVVGMVLLFIGPVVAFLVGIGVIVILHKRQERFVHDNGLVRLLEIWAAANDHVLIEVGKKVEQGHPFAEKGLPKRSTAVYEVTMRSPNGQTREGWARVRTRAYIGLVRPIVVDFFADSVEIEWREQGITGAATELAEPETPTAIMEACPPGPKVQTG